MKSRTHPAGDGSAVELGDLVGVHRDEVVIEPGVIVLDHRSYRGRQQWIRRRLGWRLRRRWWHDRRGHRRPRSAKRVSLPREVGRYRCVVPPEEIRVLPIGMRAIRRNFQVLISMAGNRDEPAFDREEAV